MSNHPMFQGFAFCALYKHAKHYEAESLEESGFSDEEIGKIHAPIGVNIAAKSAREIALSIVAELIKIKNQYL